MKQGVKGEGGPFLEIKGIGAPRDRLQVGTGSQQRFGRELAGVEADRHLRLRRIEGGAERVGSRLVVMFVHEAHEVLW